MKKGRFLVMLLASMMLITACGKAGGDEKPVIVEKVELDKSSASMKVGEELQLTATTNVENPELVWSTSNAQVATVSAGKVSALDVGEANITVQVKGKGLSAKCAITVTKDGGGEPPSGDYIIQTPVEIQIKATFNDTYAQVLKDAADELMKDEPNITVTYDKYSGSYAQIAKEIVDGVPAGNYPDITVVYPDSVADFIEAGVNLDMEPYMYNEEYGWTEEEQEDYVAAYLEEGSNYSVPGTFSLPLSKSTEAMYYDEDKIIGLTLDGVNGGKALTKEYIDSLTWEEAFNVLGPALLAYRETLETDELKKAFLDTSEPNYCVFGYDSDDNLFITLAEQYGFGYTAMDEVTGAGQALFNNDGMKGLIKTFNKAVNDHIFTTKGVYGSNVNYLSNADQCLFAIGSTGGVGYQFSAENPKNVGVAHIPHAASGKNRVIMQGPSMAFLNHKDPNRALACWLFYKYFTTVENCVIFSTVSGYGPIRQSVAETAEFLDYSNYQNKKAKTIDRLKALNASYFADVSAENILFSSPVFKGSSEARTQVGGLMTKCLAEKALTDKNIEDWFLEAYNNAVLKM